MSDIVAVIDGKVIKGHVDLARHYHKDQKYGEVPYMFHLNEVVFNLPVDIVTTGPYSPEITAAYLHDIVEDTSCTLDDLESYGVPEEVLVAVDAVTKKDGQSYEEYIKGIMDLHKEGKTIARTVKIADTMANLRNSVIDGAAGRVRKYSKQLELLHTF